jgi:hypothetical protein
MYKPDKKWMLMSQNKQQKTKCLRSDEENETLSSIAFRRTGKKKRRHIAREKNEKLLVYVSYIYKNRPFAKYLELYEKDQLGRPFSMNYKSSFCVLI